MPKGFIRGADGRLKIDDGSSIVSVPSATNTTNGGSTTLNNPAVKKYYDYAQQQVDEQAILDKFNAATIAQYNIQREQNRQAENQFYNQMYNTQQTAMDTIRQANAAAVSTGASRGVQAAQELSALLGLQQESVASATELAQANRQTAQEETAAVLENVLNAYQQAQQERQNLITSAIQAESVEVERANTAAVKENNALTSEMTKQDIKVNDPDRYNEIVAEENNAADFSNMTPEQYNTNVNNATTAIDEYNFGFSWNSYDWTSGLLSGYSWGDDVVEERYNSLNRLYASYGLSTDAARRDIDDLKSYMVSAVRGGNAGGVIKNNFKNDKSTLNKLAKEFLTQRFKNRYQEAYNKAQA